jgi:hypothetical protein
VILKDHASLVHQQHESISSEYGNNPPTSHCEYRLVLVCVIMELNISSFHNPKEKSLTEQKKSICFTTGMPTNKANIKP